MKKKKKHAVWKADSSLLQHVLRFSSLPAAAVSNISSLSTKWSGFYQGIIILFHCVAHPPQATNHPAYLNPARRAAQRKRGTKLFWLTRQPAASHRSPLCNQDPVAVVDSRSLSLWWSILPSSIQGYKVWPAHLRASKPSAIPPGGRNLFRGFISNFSRIMFQTSWDRGSKSLWELWSNDNES